MKRYEQFPHTADIGVRVFGRDIKELFENAAFAMFDVIADLDGIKKTAEEGLELVASDYEELLVLFLDELLYRFYTKSIIFSDFKITELKEFGLKARLYGRPARFNKNRLKTEIKSVSYSGLKIQKIEEGFKVEIIFDV